MNEFDLISRFTAAFDVPPSPFGPGDDAAVLPAQRQVVTTDAVVEGVHFTRPFFSFEDIGHKALAVNLSDVAAMGARPSWFTVALALPASISTRDVLAMARGMARLAKRHGATLVGGNVTRGRQLSITITAAGTLTRAPLLRSGARPGDSLYVSGVLGNAAAGLKWKTPEFSRAQRRPAPHVAFGALTSRFASACIDVSDGLVQDLGHLCRASGVGAALHSDSLPVSRALAKRTEALRLALTGGEDYVLLMAIPSRRRTAFERAIAAARLSAWHIGATTNGGDVTVDGASTAHLAGFVHR